VYFFAKVRSYVPLYSHLREVHHSFLLKAGKWYGMCLFKQQIHLRVA